jgi:hypothetical protein
MIPLANGAWLILSGCFPYYRLYVMALAFGILLLQIIPSSLKNCAMALELFWFDVIVTPFLQDFSKTRIIIFKPVDKCASKIIHVTWGQQGDNFGETNAE